MNKFNINLLLFMVIIIITSCVIFIGCGDDETSISHLTPTPLAKNGFSEYDFKANQSLYIKPNNVGVIFLEPKDANNIEMPDTEGIGVDKIPVRIPEPNTYTYSIDPNDTTNTIESVLMKNSSGEEVFRLNKQNRAVSVYLQAGNYNLFIYSGYTQAEESEANHRCVFLHSEVNVIDTGLNPSYNQNDLNQLISTKSCPGGDLSNINLTYGNLANGDLRFTNLSYANLSYAKLTNGDLRFANMSYVKLSYADIINGDLRFANLSYANLSYAKLTNGDLRFANLSNANLSYADLTNGDLRFANLSNANLSYANLNNADLNGTIMPDGSVHE